MQRQHCATDQLLQKNAENVAVILFSALIERHAAHGAYRCKILPTSAQRLAWPPKNDCLLGGSQEFFDLRRRDGTGDAAAIGKEQGRRTGDFVLATKVDVAIHGS